jgi:Rieske Fe-S protein
MTEHIHPPERRSFLQWIALGLGGLAGLAVGVPFVGYLLGPLLRKTPRDWVRLDKVEAFAVEKVQPVTFINPIRQPWDGMTANTTVFVRRLTKDEQGRERFLVFAENCAHLGCPVTWFPQSGLFMCPCHGGVYYETGERASGPPPRGLFHCVWEVRDGVLWIQAPHLPTLQDTLEKPAQI